MTVCLQPLLSRGRGRVDRNDQQFHRLGEVPNGRGVDERRAKKCDRWIRRISRALALAALRAEIGDNERDA